MKNGFKLLIWVFFILSVSLIKTTDAVSTPIDSSEFISKLIAFSPILCDIGILCDNETINITDGDDRYLKLNADNDPMTGDLDMGNRDITNIKNSVVNDNLTVGDELHVGGDAFYEETVFIGPINTSDPDVVQARDGVLKLVANGSSLFLNSIFVRSSEGGSAIAIQPPNVVLNVSSLGGTANLTLTGNPGSYTATLCDSLNHFVPGQVGKPVSIAKFTVSGLVNILDGIVDGFINSTCIIVDTGAWGTDTKIDERGVVYRMTNDVFFVWADNGYSFQNILEKEMVIRNGTRPSGFSLDDTSGAEGHTTISTRTNVNGFNGIGIYEGLLYSSTETTNILSDAYSITIDETNFNNAELHHLHLSVIGENGNDIDVIHIDGNIDSIITLGSPDEIGGVFYYNTTDMLNITGNATSSSEDVEIFGQQSSVLYVCTIDTNFTTVSVSLSSFSSHDIFANFYHCNSSHEWETGTGIDDGTNGMTESNTITFENPENRGNCSRGIDGTPFPGSTNFTCLAIERTRVFVLNPPVESLISVSGASTSFDLSPESILFTPQTSAPETCSASTSSLLYYNSIDNEYKYCDGSSYQSLGGGGGGVTVHNDLSGIQGGDTGEYFHWNQSLYTEATNWVEAVTLLSDGNMTTPGTISASEYEGVIWVNDGDENKLKDEYTNNITNISDILKVDPVGKIVEVVNTTGGMILEVNQTTGATTIGPLPYVTGVLQVGNFGTTTVMSFRTETGANAKLAVGTNAAQYGTADDTDLVFIVKNSLKRFSFTDTSFNLSCIGISVPNNCNNANAKFTWNLTSGYHEIGGFTPNNYPLEVSINGTGDISGWFTGGVSADSFVDRTKFPTSNFNGIEAVRNIKATLDGELDHDTLPEFSKVEYTETIYQEVPRVEYDEIEERYIVVYDIIPIGEKEVKLRDIGASVSINTKALQELIDKIETLEERIILLEGG